MKDRAFWCVGGRGCADGNAFMLRAALSLCTTRLPPAPAPAPSPRRYKAWFPSFNPQPPGVAPPPAATAVTVHVFPPWNDMWVGQTVNVWAFANADAVELFVNGVSVGNKTMPKYSHVEWNVPYAAGAIRAVAYVNGEVAGQDVSTTPGAATALQLAIKDGFGASLLAGCQDVALVQVSVVDAAGLLVDAGPNVTWTVTGPGTFGGSNAGDPACLVNNKATTYPAYHGLALAIVNGPAAGASGTITVAAAADGLTGASITIPVAAPTGPLPTWCRAEATL
jgi:hypothetical protein